MSAPPPPGDGSLPATNIPLVVAAGAGDQAAVLADLQAFLQSEPWDLATQKLRSALRTAGHPHTAADGVDHTLDGVIAAFGADEKERASAVRASSDREARGVRVEAAAELPLRLDTLPPGTVLQVVEVDGRNVLRVINLPPHELGEAVYEFIVDAFNLFDLTMALKFRMQVRLDRVVPDRCTHEERAFALVEWAERSRRLSELAAALARAKPERADAANLLRLSGASDPPQPPSC